MYKYFIGVDQSFSDSGICVLDQNGNIVETTSIPSSPDFFKHYTEENFKETKAYKMGLVNDQFKKSKKVKDYTKEELDFFKVEKIERLRLIADTTKTIMEKYQEACVTFEAISFGSKGATADLGMLLGYLINECSHLSPNLVEPTRVKKFAGKGNFSKEEMIDVVPENDIKIIKTFCPVDTKGRYKGLDNRVDAYWIAKYRMEKENATSENE